MKPLEFAQKASLDAISPIDGRYREHLDPLSSLFSERALIESRCRVELSWALALEKTGIFPPLTQSERDRISKLRECFGEPEAVAVKEIEARTRHDVKALELFLRERLALVNPNRIHFGLTSEDVNNLAYSLVLKEFVKSHQIPALKRLLAHLCQCAGEWADAPFPTRTHGQPATPSTAGKELSVFVARLARLWKKLRNFRFSGKCNGAVGNYSAMHAAFPGFDWPRFARDFVADLDLEHNPITTQIEDHDVWAEYFNLTRQVNNVVLDLDQDMWNYLLLGFFMEEARSGEVGSSTMPHKVNPIRFENSEGNLLLSNSLLAFLSDKLCRSRMQRDLSDSTVSRNMGVALAHSYLGLTETLTGLERVRLNATRCLAELRQSPFLLAEPVQTILRTVRCDDPYSLLKELTRGKPFDEERLGSFVEGLDVVPEIRERLARLKVEEYVGEAPRLCRETVETTLLDLERL